MIRAVLNSVIVAVFLLLCGAVAQAAPYAAIVIDARNGEVLHSRSADRVLHPASLTKMMTLYLAFEAIESGEVDVDDIVTVSRNAAAEPPSRLGLRAGQRISIRFLIRAAAIRSANDAATALAEAIGGSESGFIRRMNSTATALGMGSTTFRNAHGLTANGHRSTARDMSRLARHLMYDYPGYYSIFGRVSSHAGVGTVYNTNRRLLQSYRGATGLKTGYTNAAGYNLAASAQRGQERIIAIIFGGRSSSARYERMVQLLDMGFARAPNQARTVRPRRINQGGAIMTSFRPMPRGQAEQTILASVGELMVGGAVAATVPATATPLTTANAYAPLRSMRPHPRGQAEPPAQLQVATALNPDVMRPLPRPLAGDWAIQLGAFSERTAAQSVLTNTLVQQMEPLGAARGQIETASISGADLYRAQFVGLSEVQAASICASLEAQSQPCRPIAPTGG